MLKLFLFLIFGLLAYDFNQSKSFQESQSYKYLKESGALDYGKLALTEAKKFFNITSVWAEENIPVYYNDTFNYLKPWIDLLYNLSVILKNCVVESIRSASTSIVKNYPHIQDFLHQQFLTSYTVARRSFGDFSVFVQNCTTSLIQYANNILVSQQRQI